VSLDKAYKNSKNVTILLSWLVKAVKQAATMFDTQSFKTGGLFTII